MTSEQFSKAVMQCEKLNIKILKYMVERMDPELADISEFLEDIHLYVKEFSTEDISVLLIHLYFLSFRMGQGEIEQNGIIETFSLIKKMYSDGVVDEVKIDPNELNYELWKK